MNKRHAAVIVVISLFLVLAAFSPLPAQECLECHNGTAGAGADILSAFTAGSHHVQSTGITSSHCYVCHWEATSEGGVDKKYHAGTGAPDATVDLVVWGAGNRPTVFKAASSAVSFRASAIGTSGERSELARISTHCLGCHNDRNNDTRPFAGDRNSPRQFAWDNTSVEARYSQKGTATWSPYSTASTNGKKKVIKAFSSHGNVTANEGGWSRESGYDGNIPATRGGAAAKKVECYDCHNSHGSTVEGVTSSYRSASGGNNGGLLKETRAGRHGYGMAYSPAANSDRKSKNPYNAGAGLCFDCHESPSPGRTPWGYAATFGAKQPIMGYKDTLRFGPGVKGSSSRFSNRHTHNEIVSSHLKAGSFLNYSSRERINGLCTPCHDPHGISPTFGNNMRYAIPLLKGTWLTSPYKEDSPPVNTPTKGGFAGKDKMVMSWGKGDLNARTAESTAGMSFNIDRNTFGEGRRIAENDNQFGGLCLKCHARDSLLKNRNATMHRAVKGWGANREHSFPCSKCHQPHNSGLPRLMQTNCLEAGPSGLRDSSAAPWFAGTNGGTSRVTSTSSKSSGTKKVVKEAVVGCHVRRSGNRNGPPSSTSGGWNKANSW